MYGAPFETTSYRMLSSGITAMITQRRHRIKKNLFLNFLKP
jgi:hypothetical protein